MYIAKIRFQILFVLSSLFVLFACGQNDDNNLTPTPAAPQVGTNAVASGRWGGEHVELNITENGGAIKLDCGVGVVEQKILTNSHNQFEVKGYLILTNGPVTSTGLPIRLPTNFQGVIQNNRMSLNVSYLTINQTVTNSYQLSLGAQGQFSRCLAVISPTPTPSPQPISSPGPVHEGQWGGRGINLEVNALGATYQLDCAHGVMDHPLVYDSHGRFTSTGTIVLEHGNESESEVEDRRLANYEGVIIGNAMTLNISHTPGVKLSQSLVYGNAPRITRCH
ncbi:MAG: hypothetical protein SGI74_04860 [Oligoflexia bacterium]|nr:hypothetical protein [Oligoflexia bacterium]